MDGRCGRPFFAVPRSDLSKGRRTQTRTCTTRGSAGDELWGYQFPFRPVPCELRCRRRYRGADRTSRPWSSGFAGRRRSKDRPILPIEMAIGVREDRSRKQRFAGGISAGSDIHGSTRSAPVRSIRLLALNRENALFAGSDEGCGNRGVIARLIENGTISGMNPHVRLGETLTKLPAGHPADGVGVGELLPRTAVS